MWSIVFRWTYIFPDSNEEQVIDTTHYNLTLKSETKVEIEGGKSGRVMSKNEVTVTPLGSPAATRRGKTVRKPVDEDLDSGSCDDDGDSSGIYGYKLLIDNQNFLF